MSDEHAAGHAQVGRWNRRLHVAYYGDDFTGSADVMEVLARGGVETALFLAPPSETQLARFPTLGAFGIAGGSRTMSPAEMEQNLPSALRTLHSSGAKYIHYKLCSTFDSAPHVGSIGKAIEIGRAVCGSRPTPLIVGSPELGRYVVFANLFARSGLDSEPIRLDRHPTMQRHPVTPMDEADLRMHLARQTQLPITLCDVLQLERFIEDAGLIPQSLESLTASAEPIVLFDTLRHAHLTVIGRCLGELAGDSPLFVAGSSAIEHALLADSTWPRTERSGREALLPFSSDSRPTLIVSGSCSPVTARQLRLALAAGCEGVSLTPESLIRDQDLGKIARPIIDHIASGRSVAAFTRDVAEEDRTIASFGLAAQLSIGERLGGLVEEVLAATDPGLLIVCGGDTSMQVARALGIESLRYAAAGAPGSPICRVDAPGRKVDSRLVVFKGGQNGRDAFLADLVVHSR